MAIPSTPFLSESDRLESSIDLNDVELTTNKRWNRNSHLWKSLWIMIQVIVVLLACWGFISLCIEVFQPDRTQSCLAFLHQARSPNPYYPETLQPGLNTCDCGKTIREALSRKCVYDSLAAAWLPPYCRDVELTREFEVSGPGPEGEWLYYADEAGTIPMTISEVAELGETGGTFWALRDWHVAHCLFYWQKYTRMRDTGIIMEQRFDHIAHVRHCQHMALKPKPNPTFLVEVNVVMNSTLMN
ncbi:hypothetical protein H0G86_010414 [Trichoderma simmonsii]|uniref:Uncharacterized protein n=1 Tax=Trichoderma simmonsii TaxID=1491479 RepID=A0A8G0PJA5_9HYPO|nr:hypothetical protein H0G86_010414 [Trichoderma simmonsii]